MEKIKDIKLTDDPYFGSTTLTIFPENISVSVIYGKNGSGKTSISNAFTAVKFNHPNYQLIDLAGQPVQTSEEFSKHLYIFNEEYVDKRVRLSGDSIGTIVLFGDAGDIENEIASLNEKIKTEEQAIEKRNIDKYNTKGDAACIPDLLKKVESKLQDFWAGRQQKIRKGSRKSPVTSQLIEEILALDISKIKETDIRTEFEALSRLVEKADQAYETIPIISVDVNSSFVETEFVGLLNATYEKKQMSDMATRLLSSYEHYKSLDTTKEVVNAGDEFCPVCLRPIDQDYRNVLTNAINEAFDETVKNARAQIEFVNLSEIDLALTNYEKYLDADLINVFKTSIEKYNGIVQKYIELANVKISKIHVPINTQILCLGEAKAELEESISKANRAINAINGAIVKNKENVERLIELNKYLAAFEIRDLKIEICKLKRSKKQDEENNEKSRQNISGYKNDIIKLQAKQRNVHVAMEEINKELASIFSSKSRLRLVMDDNKSRYYVESKGHKVKLDKLSTGERNLIALIYFFEEMKHECKQGEYFKDEYIIVVDDPISSFDYENKIGVYSYLNKMIGLIYNGNKQSQLVVLSHERDVVYYLIKLLDRLRLHSGEKIPHVSLKINGKKVENFPYTSKADYTYLLQEAFEFANITAINESFESKGNEIRKLVEMYATFNYKITIDDLFTKESILDNITDSELKEYFKNRMLGMTLNADSHTREIALQYPNFDTFDLFSEEEQIRVARDILCYLYLIHKSHITAHLDSKEVKQIEKWLEELKKELSVEVS